MTLTAGNAITFVGAMVAFFRARAGLARQRLLLLASIAIGLAAVVGSLAGRVTVGRVSLAIGSLLAAAAQAIFWSAVRSHGANRPSGAFAIDPPSVIVRRGPYGWVRHPFYLAYILGFVAGTVFTENVWVWLVPIWMQAMYAVAAYQEEQLVLSSPFAAEYSEYKRQVGAFFPKWSRVAR
jgi:protein-S-isoprenylcysteine O-methyltransferase Ste14